MFERFTESAHAVVQESAEHARRANRRVGEAHLLLALLDREGSRGSFALASLGVLPARRGSLEQALDESDRRGGLSSADVRALAELGIDVPEIVARVEGAHGKGALAQRSSGRGRRAAWRPFTKEAKHVLERSLRIATAHGDRHIGDEHILLALTSHRGAVCEALADHGVTLTAVERVLYGEGEAKAAS